MTTRALQTLTWAMFGVIEIGAKRTRVGRRSRVSLGFVADAARGNFTPAGRRARRYVTNVALTVCRDT